MVVGYFNVGSGVFKMDSNGRSAKKEKYLEKDSEKKINICMLMLKTASGTLQHSRSQKTLQYR